MAINSSKEAKSALGLVDAVIEVLGYFSRNGGVIIDDLVDYKALLSESRLELNYLRERTEHYKDEDFCEKFDSLISNLNLLQVPFDKVKPEALIEWVKDKAEAIHKTSGNGKELEEFLVNLKYISENQEIPGAALESGFAWAAGISGILVALVNVYSSLMGQFQYLPHLVSATTGLVVLGLSLGRDAKDSLASQDSTLQALRELNASVKNGLVQD